MKITVDTIFIDLMNEEYSINLTYKDFKKFYIEKVKTFRDNDLKTQQRRAFNSEINSGFIDYAIEIKGL